MAQSHGSLAKKNIVATLLCQLITMACGVIVPKLIIDGFGSEAYGATTSITQFLAYIALLEGGVGSVARAALYKPLSENNMYRISLIMKEIKRFFMVVGVVFVSYVLVLACSFKHISDIKIFDWTSTFFLVVVISLSDIFQYFVGISNALLLNAANKYYIVKVTASITVIINAILVFVLVQLGCNLIVVKLASSLVYIARPFITWLYVKKHYTLVKCKERDPSALKQKWEGLGQHIAYFLHYNTAVAILTICADLTTVAVYSVYHLIVYHIQNVTFSFSAGMEAVFGDLLAKKEHKLLHNWFERYETLISTITVILFSTTAALIVPFVKLYTTGVEDANYIQPVFAIVLVLSSAVYCLRLPYHSMTIAAGHFKQTRVAAYGEAVINIVLSLILVWHFELIGVAVAALLSTGFRLIYYVIYLSKNIFERPVWLFVKRMGVNVVSFMAAYVLQSLAVYYICADDYARWAIGGVVAVVIAAVIVIIMNLMFYRNSMLSFFKSFASKIRR